MKRLDKLIENIFLILHSWMSKEDKVPDEHYDFNDF